MSPLSTFQTSPFPSYKKVPKRSPRSSRNGPENRKSLEISLEMFERAGALRAERLPGTGLRKNRGRTEGCSASQGSPVLSARQPRGKNVLKKDAFVSRKFGYLIRSRGFIVHFLHSLPFELVPFVDQVCFRKKRRAVPKKT